MAKKRQRTQVARERRADARRDEEATASSEQERPQGARVDRLVDPRYADQNGLELSRMLLSMQERAGNAAVGSLLTADAQVQREESEVSDESTKSDSGTVTLEITDLGEIDLVSFSGDAKEKTFEATAEPGDHSADLAELVLKGEPLDRVYIGYGERGYLVLVDVLIVSYSLVDEKEPLEVLALEAENITWELGSEPAEK